MTSLSKVILVFRPVPLLEWIRNKNRVAQTSDPLGRNAMVSSVCPIYCGRQTATFSGKMTVTRSPLQQNHVVSHTNWNLDRTLLICDSY